MVHDELDDSIHTEISSGTTLAVPTGGTMRNDKMINRGWECEKAPPATQTASACHCELEED